MKHRIAMWRRRGFVDCVLLGCLQLAGGADSAEPLIWTLAKFSCPIVFADSYFHSGISIYLVLFANIVTYAMIGLLVETLRRQRTHAM